jgi:cell division inhibitor SepF
MEMNEDFSAGSRKESLAFEPDAIQLGSSDQIEGNAIMEEVVLQDKPGLFSKIGNIFTRPVEDDEEEPIVQVQNGTGSRALVRPTHRYTVTIRRQITSFDDAMAAAVGIKRGEQQVLNLTATDPTLRQKIVDFMCGVNFSQEGTWEEIGEHIYLVAPGHAYIEVAPPTPRVNAIKN